MFSPVKAILSMVEGGSWVDILVGLCHALPGHPDILKLKLPEAIRLYQAADRHLSQPDGE